MARKNGVEQPEEISLYIEYTHRQVRPSTKQIRADEYISCDYEKPEDVARHLIEAQGRLSEATCEITRSYDGESPSLYVYGWRDMTEREVELMGPALVVYRKRQAELKESQETREREAYEKLRKKFERKLNA